MSRNSLPIFLFFATLAVSAVASIPSPKPTPVPPPPPLTVALLETEIITLEAQIIAIQRQVTLVAANPALALGPFVTVDPSPEFGVTGPNITFTGANIHIVNGLQATAKVNGLGNLIIGYDETNGTAAGDRGGSHNLVIGPYNKFSTAAYGGFVAGNTNSISNSGTSILGGVGNFADGPNTTVVGGYENDSSGQYSVIVGGLNNWNEGVTNQCSVIVGGAQNLTLSSCNVILGGLQNALQNPQVSYSVNLGGTQIQGQGISSALGYIFSGTIN
jgi:hypothetical protein